MAVRQRGLKDIRTLSGSGDGIAQPHKVHLKISCLELERLRRGNEREAARKRVEDIDGRMEEIDAEKKALLQLLPCAEGGGSGSRPAEAPSSSPRGKRGRKFRY
jgi:hypothetical protein